MEIWNNYRRPIDRHTFPVYQRITLMSHRHMVPSLFSIKSPSLRRHHWPVQHSHGLKSPFLSVSLADLVKQKYMKRPRNDVKE